MAETTLLLELLTEELPPRLLSRLGHAFAEGISQALKERGYCPQHTPFESYASPRRLAVRIPGVEARQPERAIERKGPALAAAHLADGSPTPALSGFARSCGVAIDSLVLGRDNKGVEVYLHLASQPPARPGLAGRWDFFPVRADPAGRPAAGVASFSQWRHGQGGASLRSDPAPKWSA